MKLRPQQRPCTYSSLLLSVVGLAMYPSIPLHAQSQSEVLNNVKVREALQQLIKKYHATEQLQAQQLASEQTQQGSNLDSRSAQPDTSIESTSSALASSNNKGSFDEGSQNFDEQNFVDVNSALVEGSRFAEGDELILGVEIGAEEPRAAISDVFAYKSKTSARVGIVTFAQLLELPLKFNAELNKAEGWLFNENNIFSLSIDKQTEQLTVFANGKTWQLTPSEYSVETDDLYLDLELLAEWFGLSFQIDESRLKLALTSKRQLPVELRLARRNKDITPASVATRSVMPYRETGYKLFTPPLLDAQVGVSHRAGQSNASYSVSGSQDLAFFTGRYYFSGARANLLNSARLTLSRESESNDLLGPAKATEFELGDIQSVGGGGQNVGRGLRFSNTPLYSSVDGQQVSLIGEVADGWDVELYRNGVLIGQELGVSDGRYDFNNVQLEFGINEFELVFYGPQGQVESRIETYNLDPSSIQQGQFRYQFSVLEANKSVFPLEEKNYQSGAEQTGLQTDVSTSYGLFDWLSLRAGYGDYQPKGQKSERNSSFGASVSLFNKAFLNSTFIESEDISKQALYDLRTQAYGQSLGVNFRRFENLRLRSDSGKQINDSLAANMSGTLLKGWEYPISYQNGWQRVESTNQKVDTFTNSIGVRTGVGSFNHSLQWQKLMELPEVSVPAVQNVINADDYALNLLQQLELEQQQALEGMTDLNRSILGSIQYRNSFNSIFTRITANYSVKPDSALTSYGVNLSYPMTPNVNTNFSVFRYQLTGQTSGNLGLNWRLNDLYLSASASYNTLSGWSGGLSARFGFGVSDEVGYFSTNNTVSQAGAVTARVFEDKNLNGVKDETEPLIAGAEVHSLIGAKKTAVTDSKGLAALTGLTPLQKTDIVVDRSSFEDPTMKTLIPGVAITGRKGRMEHIDFAVTSTGELEGTLYLGTADGQMEPAAYAMIQLVNEAGEVVDTAQSEFDGYYLFVDILPGKYKVMIDKSFTNRRNLRISDPIYLGIRGGEVINGTDIMLNRKEAVSGYAAEIGAFSSLTMLKAYWRLVISSGMNVAMLKPFYLLNETSGKYVLRAAFSQEQEKAQQVCERLKARKFKCEVNQWTTEL